MRKSIVRVQAPAVYVSHNLFQFSPSLFLICSSILVDYYRNSKFENDNKGSWFVQRFLKKVDFVTLWIQLYFVISSLC